MFGFETVHVSHFHTNVSPLPHQVINLIKAESHALNDGLGRLDFVSGPPQAFDKYVLNPGAYFL